MRHCYKIIIILSAFLGGCGPNPLHTEAQSVVVSLNPPPRVCRYLDQVTGFQLVAGEYYISKRRFRAGALNDLKNRAASLYGNYVQLILHRSGKTDDINREDQPLNAPLPFAYMMDYGNVYVCPVSVKFCGSL